MRLHRQLALLGLLTTLFLPRASFAQGTPVVDPGAATMPGPDPDLDPGDGASQKGGSGITPLIAPVPFKNTQVGWGMFLMGGIIHRFDKDPNIKPSTGMVGGFYTENGSWGIMALEAARIAHDKWRLRAMLSHMEVRYSFYGIGEAAGEAGKSVDLQQNMNMAVLVGLRRIAPGLYLGPAALFMNASVAVRDTSGLGLPPTAGDTSEASLVAFGVHAEVDTRDDDYWPVKGSYAGLKGMFFTDALGGSRVFQRYHASWSQYTPIRGKQLVLASNATICAANGGAPFWSLCAIGTGKGGLRGYTQGRYRDSVMTTVQTEARFHTAGRLGAVAFLGFGQVMPTLGDLFSARMHVAGGVGARYQLTRNFPMHLRFDLSWGDDGSLFYFGVAEAF